MWKRRARPWRTLLLLLAIMLSHEAAPDPAVGDEYSVLREQSLEIYFREDSRGEAESVRTILREAIDDLAPRLPPGDEPIRIVIPQTLAEFARLVPEMDRESTEGVAHSQTGWIIVKSRRLHRPDSSFPGTLRHELVHVLLARNTGAGNLPRWLNEGIAMKLAGELHWASPVRVARMQATGEIIEYAHLDFAFTSGNEHTIGNAYAQSLSMTEYLFDELGESSFWELVDSLNRQSFGKAVQQFLGKTPLAFWESWRKSLWSVALMVSLMSGFTAFQIMALLVIIAFVRKRRQARRRLAAWEQEEAEDDLFTVRDLEDQDPPYPWEEDDDDRF